MKECMQDDNGLHYNYIIASVESDYFRAAYGDLKQLRGVRVKSCGIESRNPFLRALFKLHWSAKLNAKVRLPFKRIWFSRMCKYDFGNDNPTCFVFLAGQYIVGCPELRDYIYRLNPKNQIVIKYDDLISKLHYRDFETVRNSADLVVTYDRGEAEKYKIHCYDGLNYCAISEVSEPDSFEWDVYFLGFAKDRLNRIHHVYRLLTDAGLRCKFIVCGTKPEEQITGAGLCYQKPISYMENIQYVKRSRCILELMQGGSDAPTLRTQEAITYKRKLLTDHSSAVSQPYFIPDSMQVFSEPEQIEIGFLKQPVDYSSFECADGMFSPLKYISFLEELLEAKK